MKLSIIVPAYNAEDYIESCLKSCFNQGVEATNYEIIVVNDGSTDNTEQKARAFKKKYTNLNIVSKLNKGVGSARNLGVDRSKGEYIYFLDADDYLAHNTLGNLIEGLEHYQPDILGFSSQSVMDNTKTNSKHSEIDITSNQIFKGIDFLASQNFRPEVWWYFIKKSFYLKHGMEFYDKKHVQDAYFTPTLISKAQSVIRIPYDVHRYRVSNISITRDRSDEHLKAHLKDLCFAIEKLYHLKNDLIHQCTANTEAIKRIHIKQQRYVFIAITRFMRSSLKPSELKKILSNFKAIDAYPLNVYRATLSIKDPLNLTLTCIFNRPFLLYPSLHAFRIYKTFRTNPS
jgi:glycosyltransferase involved in cell wall biosynthesis